MLSPNRERQDEFSLYWGDFHKHLTGPGADVDRLDSALTDAAQHLDVSTVLCYPFKWFRKGRESGIREESVGHDPEFDAWWEKVEAASLSNNQAGEFVTFPAFEWHGNRKRWGDHNVIFPEEGAPMLDEWELPDLYEEATKRDALVIPHHTGYKVGNRGKDWAEFDPDRSPVMEIFSGHGSSVGDDTAVPMDLNDDMGPRTSGGTYRDALDQGLRIGAIASNDGPGLPGTWGKGVAGVWATELTRDAILEAVTARRTYGTTGDRIDLWWEVDDSPLGSTVSADGPLEGSVKIDCPRELDRIDIIHDGRVVDSYDHRIQERAERTKRVRVLVEVGWGPNGEYGDFEDPLTHWDGEITVEGGSLSGVQPRFRGFGQSYRFDDDGCSFSLTTARGTGKGGTLPEADPTSLKQGFVLEVDPTTDAAVIVSVTNRDDIVVPIEDALSETTLVALMEESQQRFQEEFDLERGDIENPDILYHNARKVRISRAHPVSACTASVTFDLPEPDAGDGYYYVRASQVDGQYAWSSPVWVES